MSLSHEERQTLRQRRSELVKARYERERRIAARESGYRGAVRQRREQGCSGCGNRDGYTLDCSVCQERFLKRTKRGTESRAAFERYMDERRHIYKRGGDRIIGRLRAHT